MLRLMQADASRGVIPQTLKKKKRKEKIPDEYLPFSSSADAKICMHFCIRCGIEHLTHKAFYTVLTVFRDLNHFFSFIRKIVLKLEPT